MDIKPLKKYAVKARAHFTDAITARACSLGFTSKHNQPSHKAFKILQSSDLYTVEEIELILDELTQLFSLHSFSEVIERTAYTWFNRLVALRYMEVHGFLAHKILCHAVDPSLASLDVLTRKTAKFPHARETVRLKDLTAMGKSNESIFRTLLISQCNELHGAMPFLFEEITLALSSLLPENLLGKDSLIGDLVLSIPEENWLEGVEIIGWLYQYYITERKRGLTSKKLKVCDIPAATQLFTPRWIVRYLVQNTLGKIWLDSHHSPVLKNRWEYLMPNHSESSSSTKRIKQSKIPINLKSGKLNPEHLTVLDPACGSGHILVEAFDTLKDMYLEMGYAPSEIAYHILDKNLYGLDIDERAAQMASFALLMRARIDNPKILNGSDTPIPHIYSLESIDNSYIEQICQELIGTDDGTTKVVPFKGKTRYGVPNYFKDVTIENRISISDFVRFSQYLVNASASGSLTIIPAHEKGPLVTAIHFLNHAIARGNVIERKNALTLMQLVFRALLLCAQYDCVIANPPYLSSKYHPEELRNYLRTNYLNFNRDMFAAFIVRNWQLTKDEGHLGIMSPFVWMFITSYQKLREFVLGNTTITSLIKLQYSAFEGATVPICTFTLHKKRFDDYKGVFINLEPFKGRDMQPAKVIEAITYPQCGWLFFRSHRDFYALPGHSLSFWLDDMAFEAFRSSLSLGDKYPTRVGIQTSDNARFIRRWFEVPLNQIGFDCQSRQEATLSGKKWFPYNKGGRFRQWYGNHHYVINFENDGEELFQFLKKIRNTSRGALGDPDFQFKPCITWSDVSSSHFGARYLPKGFISDISGSGIFPDEDVFESIGCYLCSQVATDFIKAINPTLHFQTGNIASLPIPSQGFESLQPTLKPIFDQAVNIMKEEMTHYEENWSFQRLPFIPQGKNALLEESVANFLEQRRYNQATMESLEHSNNTIMAKAFSLAMPKETDYDHNSTTYPTWTEIDCIKRYISYGVGVILGRYRLDLDGVNDTLNVHTLSPKDSLIVVLKDSYPDILKERDLFETFKDFIISTFGAKNLKRNLSYIASILSQKNINSHEKSMRVNLKNEEIESIMRTYFFSDFFKDHLQIYSRRPIYWELCSGPKQAFKALTYYHRFSPRVLKTLRDKYLKPYYLKIQEQGSKDKSNNQNIGILKELESFSERLNLLISERFTINVDDGVLESMDKISSIISTQSGLKLDTVA